MTSKRPIDVVTGLRNTRRSMGDGTLQGKSAIATPYRKGQASQAPATHVQVPTTMASGAAIVHHVTATAVASQSIAAGGATVQWGDEADAPTEREGFDTFSTELAAGSVGDIPIDVGGFLVGFIELPFASTVDVDGWKIGRIRNGVETVFLDTLSGTDVDGVRGPFSGWLEAGDFLRCTLDTPSGVTTGTPAWLQLDLWKIAQGAAEVAETLWLDTKLTDDVTSTVSLDSGVTYTLRVTGNYRTVDGTLDHGSPDDVMFPSSGESVETAGYDADTVYAGTSSGTFPEHDTSVTIDTGSGASHVEPSGGPYSSPQSGHQYSFVVTGEGGPVTVSRIDSPNSDNNGQLKIEIFRGAV